MVITHKLKMNMEEGDLLQRLEMPLGDVSTRQIEMLLYVRQSPWMIPEDVTVLIRYQKSDGSKGEYDTLPDGSAAWSVNGNALTIAVAPQVLTAAGNVALCAEIYQEEKVLHTFTVELSVKALFGKSRGAAASQDYYYVANVLRGPVMAQPGQVLTAETVDAFGRVTKVEAVDAATLVNENGDAILCVEQELTEAEKYRARSNIGAPSQLEVDYLHGRLPSGELVFPDTKTKETHTIYAEKGALIVESQGEENKNARILTDRDSLFLTEQDLTAEQKNRARRNIDAAPQANVDAVACRLLQGMLTMDDQKNNDNMLLYAEAGKLRLKNEDTSKTVTFLTSDEKTGIVADVLAALPIYNGEAVEV